MSKIKNLKVSKRLLIVLGLVLLTTTSAYAAYNLSKFNEGGTFDTSLSSLKTNINNLTDSLKNTANNLIVEKDNHSTDVSTLNGEVTKANQYASSVSSAVADADTTDAAASSAMSAASSAINHDPSASSSSAK